ncbi:hypothetical protein D3C75_1218710 [compost metagenome]
MGAAVQPIATQGRSRRIAAASNTALSCGALCRDRGAKRPRHSQILLRPINPRTVSCRSAGNTTTLALLLPARFSIAPT